jgi:hypothetical protein
VCVYISLYLQTYDLSTYIYIYLCDLATLHSMLAGAPLAPPSSLAVSRRLCRRSVTLAPIAPEPIVHHANWRVSTPSPSLPRRFPTFSPPTSNFLRLPPPPSPPPSQLAPLSLHPPGGVAPAHPRAETPPPAATVPKPVGRPLLAGGVYWDPRRPEGTEPPGSPCQGPRPPVPPCPRHVPATHRFRITGRHPSGPGPWGPGRLFIDSPTIFG